MTRFIGVNNNLVATQISHGAMSATSVMLLNQIVLVGVEEVVEDMVVAAVEVVVEEEVLEVEAEVIVVDVVGDLEEEEALAEGETEEVVVQCDVEEEIDQGPINQYYTSESCLPKQCLLFLTIYTLENYCDNRILFSIIYPKFFLPCMIFIALRYAANVVMRIMFYFGIKV